MGPMKSNLSKRTIILLSLLLINSFITPINAAELPKEKKFIILIDVGHDPIINYDSIAFAFKELNKSLPIEVYPLREKIDTRTLSGVDLLIILPKGDNGKYYDSEINFLEAYLENGGSVLFMGSINKSLDASGMNNLLQEIDVFGVPLGDIFQFYLIGNEIIRLYDDMNGYNGYNHILNVNLENQAEAQTILNETVKRVVVESAAITVNEKNITRVFATETTYGVDKNGDYYFTNSTPVIAAFKKYENEARVGIIGFGDSLTNKTSPMGIPWVNLGDNLEFLIQSVRWLLKPERFELENIIRPTNLYLYFAAMSLVIAPISFVLEIRERKIEERKKEEEAKIKISEKLKRLRGEKNQ